MKTTIEVIVVRCNSDGSRSHGDRLRELSYYTLDVAMYAARQFLAAGLCVIVRPTYNEIDAQGNRYFREWRSFNGEALREIKFEAFSGKKVA